LTEENGKPTLAAMRILGFGIITVFPNQRTPSCTNIFIPTLEIHHG
jgi:hypothetical protein